MSVMSPNHGRYKQIFPDELADVGIPVWGDRIILGPSSRHLELRVHPTPRNVTLATLSKTPASGRSIRTLLTAASHLRLRLTAQCTAGPLSSSTAEEVAVDVKTALEHYRSILDYLAHDIYKLCKLAPRSSPPRKLYFPNAGPKETNADFHRRFQKEYPQLRNTAPNLFNHLIGIQRFSVETWLDNLVSLVNPMKHHRLAEWEEIECKSLTIHHDGVGIRIGELGVQTISISKNQELRFVAPSGLTRAIRGPQELDVNTTTVADGDSEIKFDHVAWKTTAIRGTGRSIAGLLAEIDGGVRTVCMRVARA